MKDEDEFWDIEQVAAYLNEKIGTIRSWVAARRIPFFKRGKRLKFRRSEIVKWDFDRNYYPILEGCPDRKNP